MLESWLDLSELARDIEELFETLRVSEDAILSWEQVAKLAALAASALGPAFAHRRLAPGALQRKSKKYKEMLTTRDRVVYNAMGAHLTLSLTLTLPSLGPLSFSLPGQ